MLARNSSGPLHADKRVCRAVVVPDGIEAKGSRLPSLLQCRWRCIDFVRVGPDLKFKFGNLNAAAPP